MTYDSFLQIDVLQTCWMTPVIFNQHQESKWLGQADICSIFLEARFSQFTIFRPTKVLINSSSFITGSFIFHTSANLSYICEICHIICYLEKFTLLIFLKKEKSYKLRQIRNLICCDKTKVMHEKRIYGDKAAMYQYFVIFSSPEGIIHFVIYIAILLISL